VSVEVASREYLWFKNAEVFQVVLPPYKDSSGREYGFYRKVISIGNMRRYPEKQRQELSAIFQQIADILRPAQEVE